MKYSLTWCKKRTRKEAGERLCVYLCFFCVQNGVGGGAGMGALITYRAGVRTKPQDWISRLTKAAIASSFPRRVPLPPTPFLSLASLRWYECLPVHPISRSSSTFRSPYFLLPPSRQIKKLMRDRFFTNYPCNVYHWWNYNAGPAVLFISQLGEVLLDLMGSRHREYI